MLAFRRRASRESLFRCSLIDTADISTRSVNFHSGSDANSWAKERDQVAVGIDAYRLHSKANPPVPAWSLEASAFTLVQ